MFFPDEAEKRLSAAIAENMKIKEDLTRLRELLKEALCKPRKETPTYLEECILHYLNGYKEPLEELAREK